MMTPTLARGPSYTAALRPITKQKKAPKSKSIEKTKSLLKLDNSEYIQELCQYMHECNYEMTDELCLCVANLKLGTTRVMELLGVSRRTLVRWRELNKIDSHYEGTGVVYFFKDVYEVVAYQRIIKNEKKRDEAVSRMLKYVDSTIWDFRLRYFRAMNNG